MAERDLNIRVRAMGGEEMKKLQDGLREVGLLAGGANKALAEKGAASTQTAKGVKELAKAEAQAAREAKALAKEQERAVKALARERAQAAKEARIAAEGQIRLARASGDSKDAEARKEQHLANQLEKSEKALKKVQLAEESLERFRRGIAGSVGRGRQVLSANSPSLYSSIPARSPSFSAPGIDSEAAALATMNRRFGRTAGALNLGKVSTDLGKVATGFHNADNAAKKFNTTLGNTANYALLIKGVISAFLLYRGFSFLTGQATQFFKSLVDVQHQVGIIQTQLNQTGKDYRPLLTENILKVAAQTGASMESIARAEYQIVSANIKVADSFKILELSAKAAVAGGLAEVDTAFNAALSQANVFGESFSDIYDKQFQVIRRGIFTYEQFANVVGTVSEAFASMGQDAATANASLAAISQIFTGSQLERGATGLRNAVLRISEAPEDFEALGIAVTNANGDFRNFINIAEDLKTVLAGMSDSGKASVIKSLFPDERERRGIGAFLNQLDSAEQFFVEQQFAVGSLNEAYETANDSLKTQANMFEQDLIPAMAPFVDMAEALLGFFNGLDGMLPGLNKNLATTAIIGAAIGGGLLMTGGMQGKFALSRASSSPLNAGPIRRGVGNVFRSRMPTGVGMAAGALVAGASFSAGNQPGAAGAGDYVGAALTGGAAGAYIGGPAGAAIGAAVSVAAMALGDALGHRSGPVASSFAEAFQTELDKRAGHIAEAFTAAMKVEIAGSEKVGTGGTLKNQGGAGFQVDYGTPKQVDQLVALADAGYEVQITRASVINNKPVADFLGLPSWEMGGFTHSYKGPGMSGGLRDELQGTGGIPGLNPGEYTYKVDIPQTERLTAAKAVLEGLVEMKRLAENPDPFQEQENKRAGVTKEVIEDRVRQAVRSIPSSLSIYDSAGNENFSGAITSFGEALTNQAVKMNGEALKMGDLAEALAILSKDGQAAFLKFIGAMEDGSGDIKRTLATMAVEFKGLFSGDADLAADVFSRMGDEGTKLASVFTRISQTMTAFSMLETLSAMKGKLEMVANPEYLKLQQDIAKASVVTGGVGLGPMTQTPEQQKAIQELVKKYATTPQMISKDTNILSSLGIDSVVVAEILTKRMMADLGILADSNGKFSNEQFANALMEGAKETKATLELGANSFADALFQASDMMREGLLDSTKFTADELENLGEGFHELNRFVRQKSLLEELKGMAEFAGVGTGGITGAMDILRSQMVQSGQALFTQLSDPGSLAELIAKMEFGDVTVDNSTDMSIVVRISGDTNLDTAGAARFAAEILKEINNQSRIHA